MKKVMIGILILIPIIIVFIVAMVSMIVSTQAWIAVEDLQVVWKGSEDDVVESVTYYRDEIEEVNGEKIINFYDKMDVVIYPSKANRYVIEWMIVGDITDTGEGDHNKKYNEYMEKHSVLCEQLKNSFPDYSDSKQQEAYRQACEKYGSVSDVERITSSMAHELLKDERIYPLASFVDEFGDLTESNTSGKMRIDDFCHFTVKVIAENVSKTFLVEIDGKDVKSVTLTNRQGDDSNTLKVGESKRIIANYSPLGSIIDYVIWEAKNPEIATIDNNGVITAKSAGTAHFTMKASVYSSYKDGGTIQYVESDVYTLEVEPSDGLSAKYGATAYASNARTYHLLNDLGISADDVIIDGGSGSISEGVLTIADSDVVTLRANGKTFVINVCDDDDIAIEHTSFYDNASGYVLGVDERPLKLNATWKSAFKDGTPDITWMSSNENIATVDGDGNVCGKSAGEVTITASCGGHSALIVVNVQNKIKLLKLLTSDESLAVGLARETVFASEKYVDVTKNNAKEPNYTNISVWGEPKNANVDELNAFYDAYTFEIVEGGEYGYIVENTNKLMFKPENIVGDNNLDIVGDVVPKRVIKVKVSAKYPKQDGDSRSSVKTVNITVVHGVAVYNMKELQQATLDQKEYSGANAFVNFDEEDFNQVAAISHPNIIPSIKSFEHTNAEDGKVYEVWIDPRSKRTYSICVMANCAFDTTKNEDGTPAHKVPKSERLKVYGNIYGNNKMASALTGQVEDDFMYIAWSDVTVSNLIIRANENPENGEIKDADDTKTFTGRAIKSGSDIGDWDYSHCVNINLEYTIVENALQGMSTYNSEVSLKSCILRNFLQCAISTEQRMIRDKNNIIHPVYSHLNLHNLVTSNTLGSVVLGYFSSFVNSDIKTGRFVKNDEKANEAYFNENFASKGVNLVIRQTGFFDVYNWQNVENATMFSTNIDFVDTVISNEASPILRDDPCFNDFRYSVGDETYIHYAFVIVAMDKSLNIEPTYANIDCESDELIYVNSAQVTTSGFGGDILRALDAKIYSYKNTAHINPTSTYQVNTALINRMHS